MVLEIDESLTRGSFSLPIATKFLLASYIPISVIATCGRDDKGI